MAHAIMVPLNFNNRIYISTTGKVYNSHDSSSVTLDIIEKEPCQEEIFRFLKFQKTVHQDIGVMKNEAKN